MSFATRAERASCCGIGEGRIVEGEAVLNRRNVTSHPKEIETPVGDIENSQPVGESMRTFGWPFSSIHR